MLHIKNTTPTIIVWIVAFLLIPFLAKTQVSLFPFYPDICPGDSITLFVSHDDGSEIFESFWSNSSDGDRNFDVIAWKVAPTQTTTYFVTTDKGSAEATVNVYSEIGPVSISGISPGTYCADDGILNLNGNPNGAGGKFVLLDGQNNIINGISLTDNCNGTGSLDISQLSVGTYELVYVFNTGEPIYRINVGDLAGLTNRALDYTIQLTPGEQYYISLMDAFGDGITGGGMRIFECTQTEAAVLEIDNVGSFFNREFGTGWTGVDCSTSPYPFSCPGGYGGGEIYLQIVTDEYPEETGFQITNLNNPGCEEFASVIFTVEAAPDATFTGLKPTYCADDAAAALSFNSADGNISISPQAPGAITITNNIVSFHPSAYPNGATVTITFETTLGNCTSSTSQTTQVFALPDAIFTGLNPTYCADDPADALSFNSFGNVSASPDVAGALTLENNIVFFHPSVYANGTTVTITFVAESGSCTSTTSQMTTISTKPDATFTGLNPTYCTDSEAVTLQPMTIGGTFTLSPMEIGALITDGLTTTFNPAVYPNGETVTITYTVDGMGNCSSSTSQTTEIFTKPDATFTGLNPTYCTDDLADVLSFNSNGDVTAFPDAPGVFTTSNNTVFFNPSAYPNGATVTLTFVATSGNCTSTTTQTTQIFDKPDAIFTGLNPTYCTDSEVVTLEPMTMGGTFTISPMAIGALTTNGLATIFNPAAYPNGETVTITYMLDGMGTCPSSTSQMTTINAKPDATFTGLDMTYCSDITSVSLTPISLGGTFTVVPMAMGAITTDGLATIFNPAAYPNGETVTITYTVDGMGTCASSTSQMTTINAKPDATFTGLNPTYCTDSEVVTLEPMTIGGTFTVSPIANGALTINGLATIFNPAAFPNGEMVTITYTIDGMGICPSSTSQMTTISTKQDATFTGLEMTYCADIDSVVLTPITTGGMFTVIPMATGALINDGLVTRFNPAAYPNGETVTITYTVDGMNGCGNSTSQMTTINPLPDPTFTGLKPSYCIDSPADILTFSSEEGTIYTFPEAEGALTFMNDVVSFHPSAFPNGDTVTIYVEAELGNCTDTSSQTTIIYPLPEVSITGLEMTYLDSLPPVTITGMPLGGIFTTDAPSGFTDNGNGTAIIDPTTMPLGGPYMITYTFTNENGCINSITRTVNILSSESASFTGLMPTYCENEGTVSLTGFPTDEMGNGVFTSTTPNGFTDNGNSTATLDISTITIGNMYEVTYTYTNPITNQTSFQTQTFTVNALPEVFLNEFPTNFCADEAIYELFGSPEGGVFSTTAPSGLMGNQLDPSQIPTGITYEISYAFTDLNGCTNTQSQAFIINPKPIATFSGLNPNYCSDSATVFLNPENIGGTFSIMPDVTGALVDNGINTIFDPSVYPAGEMVTITYTLEDDNFCTGINSQTTIIYRLPEVSITGLEMTYLDSLAPVTITGMPLGGIFTTDAPAGFTDNGNGTATLDPTTMPLGGPYMITYTFTNENGCINSITRTVNILSSESASFTGLMPTYCENEGTVTLTGFPTDDMGNGVFTSTTPSGFTDNGNSTATLDISTITIGNMYEVTYTYTNPITNQTSFQTQTFTVNALPEVFLNEFPPNFCADEAIYELFGSPEGGVFSTTAPSGLMGNQLDPSQIPTGITYEISYAFTDLNGCTNSQSQTFIINPKPIATFSGLNSNYCSDNTPVILTPENIGGTFSITPDVIGALVDNNMTATFDPSVYPAGAMVTITYTLEDDNFCTGTSSQMTTINPLPEVSITGLEMTYLDTILPVTITGMPLGGIFTTDAPSGFTDNGNGTATVDPTMMPLGGPYMITYTFTNENDCTNSSTETVSILSSESASFTGLMPTYCENEGTVTLTGFPTDELGNGVFTSTTPNGFTDNGNSTATLDINVIPKDSIFEIRYTYTNPITNQITFQTQTFIINALPEVFLNEFPTNFCADEAIYELFGSPEGGVFSTTAPSGLIGNQLDPSQIPTDTTYEISYAFTDLNGCTNTQSQAFIINPKPIATFSGLNPNYCSDNATVFLNPENIGGTFSITPNVTGALVDNGMTTIFDPSVYPTGEMVTITYTLTDDNFCTGISSQMTTINPLPEVRITGLENSYLDTILPVIITGMPLGGIFTTDAPNGFTDNGNGTATLDPALMPLGGPYMITYTFTNENGCTNTSTETVSILSSESASFMGLMPTYCENEGIVTLTGFPTDELGNGVFTSTTPNGFMDNGNSTATLDISAITKDSIFEVTYTYTNPITNQTSFQTQTFIVNPLPEVFLNEFPPNFCADEAIYELFGSPEGGVFSTTAPSGLMGNQLDPSQIPTGITYEISYAFTDLNGCTNTQSQAFIVNPKPITTFSGLNPNYCSDNATVFLNPENIEGAFSITPNVTGALVDNGMNTIFDPSVYPTGEMVTITYTLTDDNFCTGTSSQTTVIHPVPEVRIIGLDNSYLDTIAPVTITGMPLGGTFTTDAPSGFTDNGNGTAIVDPTTMPLGGPYLITYTFTNENDCINSITQTVNVLSSESASFTGLMPTYCENEGVVSLTGFPTDELGNGVFTITTPNGFTDNVNSMATLDISTIPKDSIFEVTYTYTNPITNQITFQTQTFLVNALPIVNLAEIPSSFCATDEIFELVASPAGGVFTTTSPTGLIGNQLDPSQTPTGMTYTLTYTFVDTVGCSSSKSSQFIVNPKPVATFSGLGAAYCLNDTPVTLTPITPNGIFSINPSISGAIINNGTDATFNPELIPAETEITITYIVTSINACTDTFSQTTFIRALPEVDIIGLELVYSDTIAPVIITGMPLGGSFITDAPAGFLDNGNGTATLDPRIIPLGGPYTITYIITNANSCANSSTKMLSILSSEAASFTGLSSTYCANENQVLLTGFPTDGNGVFTTTAPANTVQNLEGGEALLDIPNIPQNTTYFVTYQYTHPVTGQTTSFVDSFRVNPAPTVELLGLPAILCRNAGRIEIQGIPATGNFISPLLNDASFVDNQDGTALFNPLGVADDLNIEIGYTFMDENACVDTVFRQIQLADTANLVLEGLEEEIYCSNSNPQGVLLSHLGIAELTADSLGIIGLIGSSTYFIQPSALPNGGMPTITYSATSPEGCTSVLTKTITVLPAPKINLPETTIFCKEGALSPEETDETYSFSWSTGETTPEITVDTAGTYTLRVEATNGCKASNTTEVLLNEGEEVVSKFLIGNNACPGDTFHLIDITDQTINVTGYRWDFGDGTFGEEQDPIHIFQNSGVYQVQLEIMGDFCQGATFSKEITIFSCRKGFNEPIFNSIQVAPNPSSGDFSIEVGLLDKQDIGFKVVNIQGEIIENRIIRNQFNYKEQFTGYTKGVYFVHIQSLNKARVMKVVVF